MPITEQAKQEQLQRLKRDIDTSLLWAKMDEWLREVAASATKRMMKANTLIDMGKAQGEYAAFLRVLRAPTTELPQRIQAVETTEDD